MNREMTDADLAEIQNLLKTAYCNPFWRKHVSALTAEVVRLKKMLQDKELFEKPAHYGNRHDFKNDTVIL